MQIPLFANLGQPHQTPQASYPDRFNLPAFFRVRVVADEIFFQDDFWNGPTPEPIFEYTFTPNPNTNLTPLDYAVDIDLEGMGFKPGTSGIRLEIRAVFGNGASEAYIPRWQRYTLLPDTGSDSIWAPLPQGAPSYTIVGGNPVIHVGPGVGSSYLNFSLSPGLISNFLTNAGTRIEYKWQEINLSGVSTPIDTDGPWTEIADGTTISHPVNWSDINNKGVRLYIRAVTGIGTQRINTITISIHKPVARFTTFALGEMEDDVYRFRFDGSSSTGTRFSHIFVSTKFATIVKWKWTVGEEVFESTVPIVERDFEAEDEEQTLPVTLVVIDEHGVESAPATGTITIPAAKLRRLPAFVHPAGFLITARYDKESSSTLIERTKIEQAINPQQIASFADARPVFVGRDKGMGWLLLLRYSGAVTKALTTTNDGANWEELGTVFDEAYKTQDGEILNGPIPAAIATKDGQLYLTRSYDGGTNWEAPRAIHAVPEGGGPFTIRQTKAMGSALLIITDMKTLWLESTNDGQTVTEKEI